MREWSAFKAHTRTRVAGWLFDTATTIDRADDWISNRSDAMARRLDDLAKRVVPPPPGTTFGVTGMAVDLADLEARLEEHRRTVGLIADVTDTPTHFVTDEEHEWRTDSRPTSDKIDAAVAAALSFHAANDSHGNPWRAK